MKKTTTLTLLACLLMACSKPSAPPQAEASTEQAQAVEAHNPHDVEALAKSLEAQADNMPEIQPIKTADGKIQIDWSLIDTKVARAEPSTYQYPIALDSQAVANYAKAYNLSDKEAQHSIVVSMAAPEALNKLLDQLEQGYLSHELTDGAQVKLIIHTDETVVADTHDYVFADKFGEGLVLPIEIRPKR